MFNGRPPPTLDMFCFFLCPDKHLADDDDSLLHKALPGKNRNGPVFLFIPKDLAEVLTEAQAEAILIRAVAEHRRAHGL